jgi:hypothetical protein
MSYLQDPKNGASPAMQRIAPILQANIQEHSVMKYQEQMNGVTQETLQQVPKDSITPSIVEMAMAQAAQEVMNANQAMGKVESPEQQLVSIEQSKVELEKQKLQADLTVDSKELELKNKELEIKETAQIIDMLKATGQSKTKEEQAQLNRESKEAIKEAELQAKIQIEESKIDLDQRKELAKYVSEMLKKQMENQKEIDQTAIENMLKVANQQMMEIRNDEER